MAKLKDPLCVNIDGDDLREVVPNKDYSPAGRVANIQNAINIAKFFDHKGFQPVVSLVSPYKAGGIESLLLFH